MTPFLQAASAASVFLAGGPPRPAVATTLLRRCCCRRQSSLTTTSPTSIHNSNILRQQQQQQRRGFFVSSHFCRTTARALLTTRTAAITSSSERGRCGQPVLLAVNNSNNKDKDEKNKNQWNHTDSSTMRRCSSNDATTNNSRTIITTTLITNTITWDQNNNNQQPIHPTTSRSSITATTRNFSSSSSSSSSSLAPPPPNHTTTNTTLVSKDGVVGIPLDFDIASKIEGNESQILTVTLQPGQVLRAESGAMMYMTDGIVMNTATGGGLSAGFQRMLTGQNIFISDYTYDGPAHSSGVVALGTDFPSKIIRLNINEYNGKLICQKGALLCANHTVDIQIEFTKNVASGFFGGEGFILQGLTGDGDVFLKAGGTLIRRELKPGEQLRISSGCLVAFSNGVDYDVQMVKGFANVFAGGEGLFITTLTGPGVVWLQGQPPQRMISEIVRRVPSRGGIGFGIPIGGGGGGSGRGEDSSGGAGSGDGTA